jgi:non-ribosomal peptide synthetase component F
VAACINSHVKADSDSKDIGFPVGIKAWVVDPDDKNKLLPIGCVGELLAEGPTLARHYLNDDEKTKQVFINDPEWATDEYGERRKFRGYLTGDLVRQYPDGSLSFVGRKDTQIVSPITTSLN